MLDATARAIAIAPTSRARRAATRARATTTRAEGPRARRTGGGDTNPRDERETRDARGGRTRARATKTRARTVRRATGEDADAPRVTETTNNEGWSALETWQNLGLVWNFITPSSPEGRAVIKRAHASRGNKLKGISNWRKAMWDETSRKAPITFLDSHTPLPGCRGYRVCWASANDMPTGQKRAIVMFYVASTRKFYFEADIAKGAVKKEDVDEAMFKPTEEIFEAQRRIFNVNETFREVYTSMLKVDKKMTAAMSADDDLGALGLEWEKFEDTMIRQTEEMSSRRDDVADGPESPMETWSKGRGVTPPELYMQLGVNYDFHGPAGVVMQGIISTVGAARGMDMSGADKWRKQNWEDAADELCITVESTHAPLNTLGRGWKVCWIDGNGERDAPAVVVWSPDAGEYFSLGAVKKKGSCAGQSLDAILKAILGVAQAQPVPIGLKEALTRDLDFRDLIGRSPAGSKSTTAPVSVDVYDDSEEGTVYVEVDQDDDEDSDDDDEEEVDIDVGGGFGNSMMWQDTMMKSEFDVSTSSSDKFVLDEMLNPDLEPQYPSSLDDHIPDGVGVPPISRSAGYLSFVEDEFDDDDLKRELGIDRDDMYRGPKDFPDLSVTPTPTPTDGPTTTVNLREAFPQGLPRPAESFHVLALDRVDFLVSKTNDGRLDLREVFSARRDGYGRFVEEAQRVNTSAFVSLPPAYYQEIAWTELNVTNEEDFDGGDVIPSFNTTEERTTKIYLIFARNAPSANSAFDRSLDFTKPVVMLTSADVGMTSVAVSGATSDPNASLVIKNGELYCQDHSQVPTFESIIAEHERAKRADAVNATQEFLAETDTDIEAQAFDEEEDTPEIDQI